MLLSSLWRRAWFFFIWTNLNSNHTRMLCAKLSWKWSIGSEKEEFKMLNSKLRVTSFLNHVQQKHLRKTIWLYHKLIKRVYHISFLRIKWAFSMLKLSLHPMMCVKFGLNWHNYLGKDKNLKRLQTDGRTIRKTHQGFQLRWVKNKLFLSFIFYYLGENYDLNTTRQHPYTYIILILLMLYVYITILV